MKRFFLMLVGILVATAAQIVWGYVFWQQFPSVKESFLELPDGESLAAEISQRIKRDGAYYFPPPPGMAEEGQEEAAKARYEQGPIIQIHYRKSAKDPADPKNLVRGAGHLFAVAALAAICLWWSKCRGFFSSWVFVCLIGLFAVVWMDFANPIWFNHDWTFYFCVATYNVINAVLLGFILALWNLGH